MATATREAFAHGYREMPVLCVPSRGTAALPPSRGAHAPSWAYLWWLLLGTCAPEGSPQPSWQ